MTKKKDAQVAFVSTEQLLADTEMWVDESENFDRLAEMVAEIAVLHTQLMAERKRYELEHATRIELEQRLAKRGARIHALDEIRKFEGETEKLLVEALDEIVAHSAVGTSAYWYANTTLNQYADRRGPRKVEKS